VRPRDVVELVRLVKAKVRETQGIDLHCEVAYWSRDRDGAKRQSVKSAEIRREQTWPA
jgi:hypothetical protein